MVLLVLAKYLERPCSRRLHVFTVTLPATLCCIGEDTRRAERPALALALLRITERRALRNPTLRLAPTHRARRELLEDGVALLCYCLARQELDGNLTS